MASPSAAEGQTKRRGGIAARRKEMGKREEERKKRMMNDKFTFGKAITAVPLAGR